MDLKKLFASANTSWLIAGERKENLLDIVAAPAAKRYPPRVTHSHSSIHNAARACCSERALSKALTATHG